MGEGASDYREDPLWQRLARYRVGPPDAAFSFEQRLARENGWSEAHAGRVVDEYRRFCYLAMRAGHEVTPSDAVDQAWHLHLTYSRDYWQRFCPDVLEMPLHHGPTAGGEVERDRYYRQYAETLASYERVFGPSPADIWPDANRRLYRDPLARRVHPRDHLIVPKRLAIPVIVLALVGAIIAAWQLSG
ncbi:glycine-rich domain-containing protein [Croceicoccus bisphenolivorans]|uniref:glycine-rich domain-containing protein n=1 Tax=Croceicoccus bisphenolivorans TaxID=1783232 RepID=UPI00082C385F|nr:hypothetical protein [Croceicoccus bisphenolivorans]